jgi:hypothetical protein
VLAQGRELQRHAGHAVLDRLGGRDGPIGGVSDHADRGVDSARLGGEVGRRSVHDYQRGRSYQWDGADIDHRALSQSES